MTEIPSIEQQQENIPEIKRLFDGIYKIFIELNSVVSEPLDAQSSAFAKFINEANSGKYNLPEAIKENISKYDKLVNDLLSICLKSIQNKLIESGKIDLEHMLFGDISQQVLINLYIRLYSNLTKTARYTIGKQIDGAMNEVLKKQLLIILYPSTIVSESDLNWVLQIEQIINDILKNNNYSDDLSEYDKREVLEAAEREGLVQGFEYHQGFRGIERRYYSLMQFINGTNLSDGEDTANFEEEVIDRVWLEQAKELCDKAFAEKFSDKSNYIFLSELYKMYFQEGLDIGTISDSLMQPKETIKREIEKIKNTLKEKFENES